MLDVIDYLLKNDSFIMSLLTMIIGIYAGFIPSFKSHGVRIGCSLFFILFFNICIWIIFCNKYNDENNYFILYGTIVSVISLVFLILCIFKFKPKDIVSRRKLGKIIIKLTDKADGNSPVCIFGGDLDFFGNVIKKQQDDSGLLIEIKNFFSKDYNSNIEYNEQMQQIVDEKYKNVHILCTKPDNSANMKKMRLRYGYIAKKLEGRVAFKFVQDTLDINSYSCTKCTHKKECNVPKPKRCLQLEEFVKRYTNNPDTKLRGRIIERSDTHAKDIFLTTTIECKKKYRIKEYGLLNKHDNDKTDWKLYEIIWEIWWERCPTDDALIKRCIKEYEEFVNG